MDVLIGFSLCLFAFKAYHYYVNTIHLQANLLNRLLLWYEEPDQEHSSFPSAAGIEHADADDNDSDHGEEDELLDSKGVTVTIEENSNNALPPNNKRDVSPLAIGNNSDSTAKYQQLV